ncbi:MAG: hypothetical protein U0525_03090 [Patescibacteria group bacterium]
MKTAKEHLSKYSKQYIVVSIAFLFLLHLAGLNQSLWLDEATSAKVVMKYNPFEIVKIFSPYDFHPSGYYIVLWVWSKVFGTSEIALRSLSLLAMFASCIPIYLSLQIISKEKYRTPLIGIMVFLTQPLIWYYSHEARMYSLVVFYLSVYTYCFIYLNNSNKVSCCSPAFCGSLPKHEKSPVPFDGLRANLNQAKGDTEVDKNFVMLSLPKHERSRVIIVLAIFFGALSILTFYGSVLYIAGLILTSIVVRKYKVAILLGIGPAVGALIVLPLLLSQLSYAKQALLTVVNWSQVLGVVSPKNIILIPLKFVTGRISLESKKLYYSLFGINLTLLIYIFAYTRRSFRQYLWIVLLLVFPIIFAIVISFGEPMLSYFRLLYIAIPLTLLLAIALSRSNKYLVVIVIMVQLIWSLTYALNPNYHREDWKTLAANMDTKDVYMIPSSSDPLAFYNSKVNIKSLKTDITNIKENKIVVIPYTSEIHGVDYRKILVSQKFSLTKEYSYRGGLTKEVWGK